MEKNKESTNLSGTSLSKLAIATFAAVVILGAAVYAAYRYSQKQMGNIVLPGGVTYLGASPTSAPQPPTAPLRFTTDSTVSWNVQTGNIYPFSFSFPSTLPLVVFPGDTADSVAIAWGNIQPQLNILLNMEFIDKRDESYVGKPKIEFVRNWHKYFSGLKDVSRVDPFTNTSGLKGYRASYINYAGATPNTDIFFEVPGSDNMLIHVANGIIDPVIFDRMVDSLKWTPPTTAPNTPTPTAAKEE